MSSVPDPKPGDPAPPLEPSGIGLRKVKTARGCAVCLGFSPVSSRVYEVYKDLGSDIPTYRAWYFGCLKGVSKPVQVLCSSIEAVMLLT